MNREKGIEVWTRKKSIKNLEHLQKTRLSGKKTSRTFHLRFAKDKEPNVRLSFIWASENIATNNPDIYGNYMSVFDKLLSDSEDRVRMEAPEIFRVLGKRRPEFVKPYEQELRMISETDENRVVRIHCLGAVKALETKV